jgi:transposase-like protein
VFEANRRLEAGRFVGCTAGSRNLTAVFPESQIQTCIVHLLRNSLSFCNWKERKLVATELKKIYSAETAELAAKRLDDFERYVRLC